MGVGVIILAAGQSRRMGEPKLLLPWGSGTVIAHVVGVAASVAPVVVVASPLVREALGGAPVVEPAGPAATMLASVQAGLRALPPASTGWLVMPGDLPLVSQAVYHAVVERHRRAPDRVVIPTWEGRRGHPSLFPASLRDEALALDPTADSLRTLLERHAGLIETVPVDEPGIRADLDTPEDYRRLTGRD